MATRQEIISEHMREIGRKGGLKGGKIGGKSTTKRKADAARANGHKGGRPRKETRQYCSLCGASLTSADLENRACTQCGDSLEKRGITK
jgi:general stress protein YciG